MRSKFPTLNTHFLTLLLLILLNNFAFTQVALNVDLLGEVNRGDSRYSGSWSYVDADGNEYALIGARTGLAAYSIDDPSNMIELGFVPGPESNWREIMVLGNHAYVTTEGSGPGEGMQVVDLSFLPDSLHLTTTYTSTFTTGHILQKDIYSDSSYIYVNGVCNTCGVNILDVSDPAQPIEIGTYYPDYYIHDCMVKGDLMFASAFYNETLDIVDISDKTNPILITQIAIPGGRVHSSWVTEDDKYLFVCPEQDGLVARVYNIEDLTDIFEVSQYTANIESLVHNPYIKGDLAIISHNTEGLRILDLADPTFPVEVGYYDTFDGESGGFSGLWSACPFFPSGKVIGGDRTRGLMVWSFDENLRAARVFGLIRDSISQAPLMNAQITVNPLSEVQTSDFLGEFKIGIIEGQLSLEIQRGGYMPKTINLDLSQGDSENLIVDLVPNDFVDVNEVSKNNSLVTVFPNPGSKETVIQFGDLADAFELVLYDNVGKALKRISIENKESIQLGEFLKSKGLVVWSIENDLGHVIASGRVVY